MKQIYSTGPTAPNGRSSVRAQSPGTDPAWLDVALAATAYPGHSYADARPVRLALLKSAAGRLLTHVTPSQNGDSFAHTILDVPPTADAQLAIQTWGSPLWQTRSPEGSTDLPELPHLPVADVLDDAALQAWLKNPRHHEALEFVLSALLSTLPQTPVIVAAPASDVATIVYAVTRVLPHGLLEDFTFSTYEADPSQTTARLIGTDPTLPRGPEGQFAGPLGAVAVELASGEHSPLPGEVPFAAFAVSRLAGADTSPLEEVKLTWQRLGLNNPTQLDLVYRLTRGTGVLTRLEAAETLAHPPLAAFVSTRADVMKQFLDWALEDRSFAQGSFPRAVQALRQRPDALAKLATQVKDAGLAALKVGELDRAANAFELILPTVTPTKANAAWGELLAHFAEPAKLPYATRRYLLPRLVRFKQFTASGQQAVDPALEPWLAVEPAQLPDFLSLDLPRHYQTSAVRGYLATAGKPESELVYTLIGHPQLVRELLKPAPGHEATPVKLFEALLSTAPNKPWLETALEQSQDYPPELLSRFTELALTAGALDADRLVRSHGPRLLQLMDGQPILDQIGTQFLAKPPADLLHNADLVSFLKQLGNQAGLSQSLQTRVASVQTVRSYLDHPSFDADAQRAVRLALETTPPVVPPGAKAEAFAALTTLIYAQANDAELQSHLETSLVEFGPVLAASPVDLYENTLRELRTTRDFPRHPNLVPTFLAVALGATKHEKLAGQLDGLDGHAFAVATDAIKHGGKRMLAELDLRAKEWPRAAQAQWSFLRTALKPRGLRDQMRDALLVAAGALAASAVWGVATLVLRGA